MAKSPVELKIVSAIAISAVLRDADPTRLEQGLRKLAQAGSLFDRDLCVIDVGALASHVSLPWARYRDILRAHGLCAVAVRNAAPDAGAEIQAAGLVLESSAAKTEGSDLALATVDVAGSLSNNAPMIVDVPVRAGQQIYARGCDLIVTQVVNNGAEIIADGSIHVYAPLRGRALAGAKDNANARIFTLSMEAELVSVAGIYRNFESGLPSEFKRQACEISLAGESLNIRRLNAA